MERIIEIQDMYKIYNPGDNEVRALDGVSLSVDKGDFLAIVGHSGSGKSTLMNMLGCLDAPTSGLYRLEGQDVSILPDRRLSDIRNRFIGFIFQGFHLIPGLSALENVELPLMYQGMGRDKRRRLAAESLERVGLGERLRHRPAEMSGGQQQRVGIARALAVKPEFIVCDEPISALDVSIQAQVINMLIRLQKEMGLTYLFVAHDLSMVKHISDRVAVMYLGQIVEITRSEELYSHPLHPYTQALLSAIPIPDPIIEAERETKRIHLEGEVTSPIDPAPGCRFASRCPYATARCKEATPTLKEVGTGHEVACFRVTGE